MHKPLVLDGAAGTFLESQGIALHPILWSSGSLLTPEGQEAIRDLHRAYIDAGADVITTVTYQASIPGLMESGLSKDESSELITRGVTIAREEADKKLPQTKIKVAGGLGAYGSFLRLGQEYTGDYGKDCSYEVLRDFWVPRAEAVLKGKPDVLLFETIPNLLEIEVLIKEVAPLAQAQNIPVWLSLSLRIPSSETDEITLADGSSMAKLAEIVNPEKAHIHMVGANCFDVNSVNRVIDAFKPFTLPLLVYPNMGEIYDGRTKTWQSSHANASDRPWHPAEWRTRGVDVIGGCCRTTPKTISQINEGLDLGTSF